MAARDRNAILKMRLAGWTRLWKPSRRGIGARWKETVIRGHYGHHRHLTVALLAGGAVKGGRVIAYLREGDF